MLAEAVQIHTSLLPNSVVSLNFVFPRSNSILSNGVVICQIFLGTRFLEKGALQETLSGLPRPQSQVVGRCKQPHFAVFVLQQVFDQDASFPLGRDSDGGMHIIMEGGFANFLPILL